MPMGCLQSHVRLLILLSGSHPWSNIVFNMIWTRKNCTRNISKYSTNSFFSYVPWPLLNGIALYCNAWKETWRLDPLFLIPRCPFFACGNKPCDQHNKRFQILIVGAFEENMIDILPIYPAKVALTMPLLALLFKILPSQNSLLGHLPKGSLDFEKGLIWPICRCKGWCFTPKA